MTTAAALQTLTCTRCGSDWQRPVAGGPRPRFCPDCRPLAIVNREDRKAKNSARALIPPAADPWPRVATYRAAINHAIGALRTGRTAEALAVLEDATH